MNVLAGLQGMATWRSWIRNVVFRGEGGILKRVGSLCIPKDKYLLVEPCPRDFVEPLFIDRLKILDVAELEEYTGSRLRQGEHSAEGKPHFIFYFLVFYLLFFFELSFPLSLLKSRHLYNTLMWCVYIYRLTFARSCLIFVSKLYFKTQFNG